MCVCVCVCVPVSVHVHVLECLLCVYNSVCVCTMYSCVCASDVQVCQSVHACMCVCFRYTVEPVRVCLDACSTSSHRLLSLGAQGPALSRGRTPSPQSSPPLSVLCRCFEELAHPHGVIYEQECQHLLRVAYQSTHPENPLLFHACTGTVCIPFQV